MSEIIITDKDQLFKILNECVNEAVQKAFINIQPQPHLKEETFIGVDAAAELLHKKRSTIYHLVRNRIIPVYKRGNRLLFKKNELELWVDQCKQKTNDEIAVIAKQRNK